MSTCHRRKAGRKRCRDEMSGQDNESCDIMRHHATSCDRERKRVGSGWRKTSFVRRRCGRETRWRERKRKAGGSRKRKRKTSGCQKRKGFPLQLGPLPFRVLHNNLRYMAFQLQAAHHQLICHQCIIAAEFTPCTAEERRFF